MLLSCLAVPSFAAHYGPASYSGGACVYGNPSTTLNYMSDGHGGWGRGATGSPVNCSGPITTTFTWTPDYQGDQEPPPPQVVVCETCTAQWSGGGYVAPTGAANNGLGFPYSETITGGSGSGSSTGTRYSILPGASTLTLPTVSPSASASETMGYVTASVSYTAGVSPLEVILTGGIGPKDAKRFLIGQQVTAYVATGGLYASYVHWSISGGSPFSDYVVGDRAVYDNSNPPQFLYNVTDGYGVLVPWDSEDSDLTVFYHYAKPASSTVACAVHLDVPAGCKPESGLDAAPVRNCGVDAPAFWHDQNIGSVGLSNTPFTGLYLTGASYSDAEAGIVIGSGTCWIGSVTTPADYVPDYGPGNWQFTQTFVPDFERTVYGAQKSFSLNATNQLDVRFNYAGENWAGDGRKKLTSDRPGMPFGDGFTMVHDKMVCEAYMMYKPGGGGSCFVPLTVLNWHWDATATRGGNGIWTPTANDTPAITPGADFPDPPQWVRNYIEGTWN